MKIKAAGNAQNGFLIKRESSSLETKTGDKSYESVLGNAIDTGLRRTVYYANTDHVRTASTRRS